MSLSFEDLITAAAERGAARALERFTPPAPSEWASIPTIRARFDVSATTVRQALKAGLPSIGSGKLRRIRVADFEKWLRGAGGRDATDLDAHAAELAAPRRRAGGVR